MSVTLTFVDTDNNILKSFPAEDHKSISQIAEKNGIEIPISCCHGSCMVCNCKIKKGAEFVQIDKIMPPKVLPKRDADGKRTEVLSCIGGITSDAIKDNEEHEVILEKYF